MANKNTMRRLKAEEASKKTGQATITDRKKLGLTPKKYGKSPSSTQHSD